VCAFDHRRYTGFNSLQDEKYYRGISFFTFDNTRIDNFPKYHSQNLTAKHQATKSRFKPAVRIFKNIRSKLIERGSIANGEAPSYFIEGLLYNGPNDHFVNSLTDTTFNILRWLHQTTDRSQFACANDLYYLLRDSSRCAGQRPMGRNSLVPRYRSGIIGRSLTATLVQKPRIIYESHSRITFIGGNH
jgi:hypothetical protein